MRTKLPASVTELLTTRIDSFEKLELVVALHEAPRTTLSTEALVSALGLSRATVRQTAEELNAGALVDLGSNGEIQLLPPTNRERDAVAELVRIYREDRVTVVTALGEIAVDRIRNMASRVFADAFVIRKKPRGNGDNG